MYNMVRLSDVLDITKLLNPENLYKGTSLSNGQLLLSK